MKTLFEKILDGAGLLTLFGVGLLFLAAGYLLATLVLMGGIKVLIGFLILAALVGLMEAGVAAILMLPYRLWVRIFGNRTEPAAPASDEGKAQGRRVGLYALCLLVLGAMFGVGQHVVEKVN
ncbi:hypothetical protein RYH70_06275 [Alloalcanivorax xenomutans]|uniref:hypothetical protein n=1 Tax=Alloalcanivorax xenomutans TaxID=1094342 RepID=UPI002934872A|nr:hypothetical protein [Alloalcanivorax xenomutans]WOD29671.1 hypothetical protein RYH70_06275 [Alloalcanivorax xenomutans]